MFPKFSNPKYRSPGGTWPSIAFSSFVEEFPWEVWRGQRSRRSETEKHEICRAIAELRFGALDAIRRPKGL